MIKTKIIIDASGGVLGRIASFAAKQSLFGKEIVIVNCNEALITGRGENTLSRYTRAKKRGGSGLKGPRILKSPERIMKRTVRGMLSHKQLRGREAFRRIMCYNLVPDEFVSVEKISLVRPIKMRAIKLQKLSEVL